MDSTGPPAAPTALYTNVASPTAKPPSSTPSRLPNGRNGGTGGNRTSTITKTAIVVMTTATTARTTTAAEAVVALLARPPPPLVPTARPPMAGAHDYVLRPCARWTAASVGLRGHIGPLCVSRPPVRATAAAAATVPAGRPGPRMEPLARRRLGPAVAS
jgi:hypothetical protein